MLARAEVMDKGADWTHFLKFDEEAFIKCYPNSKAIYEVKINER